MTDNKGNKWHEKDYEGYGVFGGKDFYQLLAEMNNVEGLTGDVDNDREFGIDLFFSADSGKPKKFIAPNLTEDAYAEWTDTIPKDCPDQGWVRYKLLPTVFEGGSELNVEDFVDEVDMESITTAATDAAFEEIERQLDGLDVPDDIRSQVFVEIWSWVERLMFRRTASNRQREC